MHHKAIFVGVSQITLILGIKFSAGGIRDFLGTPFKLTTPELKRVSGLPKPISCISCLC